VVYRHFLLLILLILQLTPAIADQEINLVDKNDNEISIKVYPSDSNLLIIWLVDHEDNRKMFENMINAVHASPAEIWRVDLLGDYFLPRGGESRRTLSGDGVEALLTAAHKLRNKTILLVTYDRLPLPLLRGVRQWQQYGITSNIAGAVLFYPNLFGPAPVAGEAPVMDPIVEATNIPVVIFQPETGSQRWRIVQVLEAFWRGGSPAFSYLVPEARDWFFMGDIDHGTGAAKATKAIPEQLKVFADLMNSFPKPKVPNSKIEIKPQETKISELVEFKNPIQARPYSLMELNNDTQKWQLIPGKVTLINFWATWCPPCVEEIPSLNRLAKRYNGKAFEIISIDYREDKKELKKFIKNIPVNFPILLDKDGKTAIDWKVFSFPSSFIIGKNGQIRYSANRAIDWDTENSWQIIDRLLLE